MNEMNKSDNYLEVKNLKMYFPLRKGLSNKPYATVKAVDGISFKISKGETFGLVGESGCGKTTVGRCILRMYEPTEGQIVFNGQDITHYNVKQMKPLRSKLQIIFQDPYSSLDPRQSIKSIIKEAVVLNSENGIGKDEINARVNELIELVGLDSSHGIRFPHELSGGQRQRVGIARALACNPDVIVCDEPVSALDVSIQAQVINLFEELKEKLNLTYVFIAHDLAVVRHISDTIAVMYLGRIMEITSSDELYDNPIHPYTNALLSAIPIADYDLEQKRTRIVLEKEIPSPINPPKGCPFHPRCKYATGRCFENMPDLIETSKNHFVACHIFGKK